jgi:hypothetical protein
MSAWGHGNFENDIAQDMLADLSDDYFRRIIDTLQSENGHEYDEYAHDELFVLSEILFAMHDRGMVNSSPEPEEIRPLCGPFTERWAAYLRSAGHEPSEGRRAVMANTFERLIQIAESACRGSFAHRIGLITDKMSKVDPNES